MSRILRAGTVLDIAEHPINITLEADAPVADAWGTDDHFAGWAFLTGNLPLYVKDLAVYEVDEIALDGQLYHNVYDRNYANNAVKELTLLSSTLVAKPDGPTEDELKQQAVAAEIQKAADEAAEAKAAKIEADAEAAEKEAKAETKSKKADKAHVLDKTDKKAS